MGDMTFSLEGRFSMLHGTTGSRFPRCAKPGWADNRLLSAGTRYRGEVHGLNYIRIYLDRVLKNIESGYTPSFALGCFHH